jgi:poly(A) polymerase
MVNSWNDPRAERAAAVVRVLRAHGFQAYFVGGCVRDLLLGRLPADYDVATDARPEQVVRLFPNSLLVGAQFGVVLVKEDGQEIAIATFRQDNRYVDGRHPESVSYTSDARQDVLRRDFTINGLLLDPLKPLPLEEDVLDYVGGRQDLAAGVIRTIGDPAQRFAEDRLRLLRAIRFAARFGFRIEAGTWEAIRGLHAGILEVSRERIREEIIKILTEGGAATGLPLMDESGLLMDLLPEVAAMKGVAQPPEFHPEGDVWTHTLLMLAGLPPHPSPTLALGVLLHDIGKPPTFRLADRIRFDNHAPIGAVMAEKVCERLRMSRRETGQIVALVENHLRFKDVVGMRPARLKRFLGMEGFAEHLELHRLDCVASHGNLDNYEFLKRKLAEMPEEELRPAPLVTGDDLITLGYEPGPAFKEMLQAVMDAQMEGELRTKEEALAFIRSRFPKE